MNIAGACHCGSITWKAVANPDMVAICYCTDCQTFGSFAFQYTARIKREDFELTSGQLKEHGKIADMEQKMLEYAKNLEIEEAAALRDEVTELKQVAFAG